MSWQAGLVHGLIRTAGKLGPSVDKQRAALERRGPTGGSVPKKLAGVDIVTSQQHGMTVVRLSPSGSTPGRTVFYAHGGSYCFEAASLHWSFLRKLATEANVVIDVPLYPLAPDDTAATTVPSTAAVLGDLGSDVVMGDSAGGGLALAVAQHARDAGTLRAQRLVLLAPWLDVRTADPRQKQMEGRDVMLKVDVLQLAGRLYTGDLAADDPLVAPVLGDLRGLPPISVFVGSEDLLVVDTQELEKRCAEAGQPIEVVTAPGMQHVYPVLPLLPEARAARAEIAALLRG